MKKLFAVFCAFVMVFLSGCQKSVPEYFSEINGFFEEKIVSITESKLIDKSETVTIIPKEIVYENPELSAYEKLTDNQKKLYSIILTAVQNMELKLIDVTDYSSGDVLSQAIPAHRAVMCDRPDFFWMPKTLSVVSVDGRKEKYICFKDYNDKNDTIGFYGITPEQKSQMAAKIETIEGEITRKANLFSTAFDKELFIHDYLCENIVYDTESADDLKNANVNSTTIYGALIEGKAICEGYSKAMQYLCLKSGIPCSVVYGEHNGVAHMWNIVNPGDGFYYLDVTFDDGTDSTVLHYYFNLTKAKIEKDHIFSEEFSNKNNYDVSDDFNFFNENCNNTALNYFERTGAYITDDCIPATDFLLYENSSGKRFAELKNISSFTNSKAIAVLQSKLDTINFKKSYEYGEEKIIVVIW